MAMNKRDAPFLAMGGIFGQDDILTAQDDHATTTSSTRSSRQSPLSG